jgi:hypothetical protein
MRNFSERKAISGIDRQQYNQLEFLKTPSLKQSSAKWFSAKRFHFNSSQEEFAPFHVFSQQTPSIQASDYLKAFTQEFRN